MTRYWELRPGPERAAAKAELERLAPMRETPRPLKAAQKVERVKLDGRNVIVANNLIYQFDNAEGERLARSMARFGIPPLPVGVSVVRDGDNIFLTDGKYRVPVDPSGNPRVLAIVTNQFRQSPEKDH